MLAQLLLCALPLPTDLTSLLAGLLRSGCNISYEAYAAECARNGIIELPTADDLKSGHQRALLHLVALHRIALWAHSSSQSSDKQTERLLQPAANHTVALPASAAAYSAAQQQWLNASGSQVWPFQVRLGARGVASRHGAGSGMAAQVAASARYYALPVAKLTHIPEEDSDTSPRVAVPSSTPAAVAAFLNLGDWRPRSYAEHAALNSGVIGPLQPPARRRLWRYLLRLEPEAFGPVVAPLLGGGGLFKGGALPSAVPPERRALVWNLIRAGVPPELRGWWWCANSSCFSPPQPLGGFSAPLGETGAGSSGSLREQYTLQLRTVNGWLHTKGEVDGMDAVPVPSTFPKSVSQLANDIRRTMQHLPEVALYSVHLRWETPAVTNNEDACAPCAQLVSDVRRVSGRADIDASTQQSRPGGSTPDSFDSALPGASLTQDLTGRGLSPSSTEAPGDVPTLAWTTKDFAQRCQLTAQGVAALGLPTLPPSGGLGYFIPPLSQAAVGATESSTALAGNALGEEGRGQPVPSPAVVYIHVAVTCASLWRVCLSAALAAPVAGYCQGLNFIAAHALRWMDEAHAAALLGAVTSRLRLGGQQYYGNMGPPAADLGVLQGYVQYGCPDLLNCAMGMHGAPPSTDMLLHTLTGGGLKWLLCLFATPFPPALTSRVWDAYFAGGATVLFSTTVALLRLCTPWVRAFARSFPDIVAAVEGIGGAAAAALRAVGEAVGEGVHDPLLPVDTPPQDGAEGTSDLADSVLGGDSNRVHLWAHGILSGRCAEVVDWPVVVARTSASQRSIRGGGSLEEVAPIYKLNMRPIAGAAPVSLLTLLFEGFWNSGAACAPTSRLVPPLVDASAQSVLSELQSRMADAADDSSSKLALAQAAGDAAAVAAALLPSRPDSHTASHAEQALTASILAWTQAQGWGCAFHTSSDPQEPPAWGEAGVRSGCPLWASLDTALLLRAPGHSWITAGASVPHHDLRMQLPAVPGSAPARLWQPHVLVTAPTAAHVLRFVLPPLFRGGLTDNVLDSALLSQVADSAPAMVPGTAWWIGHHGAVTPKGQEGGASGAASSETNRAEEAGALAAQAALSSSLERDKRELGPGTPTGSASELTRSQRGRGVTASTLLAGAEAGSPRLTAWFMLQAMLRHASGPTCGPLAHKELHPALQRATAVRQLLCALGQWMSYKPLNLDQHDATSELPTLDSLPPLDLGSSAGQVDHAGLIDAWQGVGPLPSAPAGTQAPLGWPSALILAVSSPFNGDILHNSQRVAGHVGSAHPALLLAMGVPVAAPAQGESPQGASALKQAAPLSPPLGAPRLLGALPEPALPQTDASYDAGEGEGEGAGCTQYLGGDSHTFHLPALTVLPLHAVSHAFTPAAWGSAHPFAFQMAAKLSCWWPMHGAPEGPQVRKRSQDAGKSTEYRATGTHVGASRSIAASSPGLVLSSGAGTDEGFLHSQPLPPQSPVTPLLRAVGASHEGDAAAQVRIYSETVEGTCEHALAASPLLWHVLAGALGTMHAPYTAVSLLPPFSSTAVRMRQDAGTVQLVSVGEEQLFQLSRPRRLSAATAVDGRSVADAGVDLSKARQDKGFLSRVFRWGNKTKPAAQASKQAGASRPKQTPLSPSGTMGASSIQLVVWGDKARLLHSSVLHVGSVAFEVPMHAARPGVHWPASTHALGAIQHATSLVCSHPCRVLASLPVPFSTCSWSDAPAPSGRRATRKSLTVPPRPPSKDLKEYSAGGSWGVWALFPSMQWLEGAFGVLCTPPSPQPETPAPRRIMASSSKDSTPVAHPHGHSLAAARRGGMSSLSSPITAEDRGLGDSRTPPSSQRSARRSLAVLVDSSADKKQSGPDIGDSDLLQLAATVALSSALWAGADGSGLEGLARVEVGLGGLQAQRRIRWAAEAASQWNSGKNTGGMNYPEFCNEFGVTPLASLSGEERLLLLPPDAPDADLLWHQSQEDIIAGPSVASVPMEGATFPADTEVEGGDLGGAESPAGPGTRKGPSMRRSAEVRPLNALQRIMPGRGDSIRRFALVSRRAGCSGAPPPLQPCQRIYAVWFNSEDLAPPLGAVPHPDDGRVALNMHIQEEGALMLHLADGAPSLLIEGYFRPQASQRQQTHKATSPTYLSASVISPGSGSRLVRGSRAASDAHSYTPHAHLMVHKRRAARTSPRSSAIDESKVDDSSSVATAPSDSSARDSPRRAAPDSPWSSAQGRAPMLHSRRGAPGSIRGGLAPASTSTRNVFSGSGGLEGRQLGTGLLSPRCPGHLRKAALLGAGILPLPLALEAPAESVHAALRASMEGGQGGGACVDLGVHDSGEEQWKAQATTEPIQNALVEPTPLEAASSLLSGRPAQGGFGSLGKAMSLQLARLAADDDSSDDGELLHEDDQQSPVHDTVRSLGGSMSVHRGLSVLSLGETGESAAPAAASPELGVDSTAPDIPQRRTKRAASVSTLGQQQHSSLMGALLGGMSGHYICPPVVRDEYFCEMTSEALDLSNTGVGSEM